VSCSPYRVPIARLAATQLGLLGPGSNAKQRLTAADITEFLNGIPSAMEALRSKP
jgi:hypothetical protein